MINPAAGLCLQLIAAIIKQDAAIFYRDVWPLIFPSIIGAIIGGYFTHKFYEPLLLYIKYKDLAEGQGEISEEDEREEKMVEEEQWFILGIVVVEIAGVGEILVGAVDF